MGPVRIQGFRFRLFGNSGRELQASTLKRFGGYPSGRYVGVMPMSTRQTVPKLDALTEAIAEVVAARVLERLGAAAGPRRLISLKEAGEFLGGKTASSVRSMINSGVIPASIVKRLGQRRISLDRVELDKWISVL